MPLSIAHADHGEWDKECCQHCDCDDVHCVSFVCCCCFVCLYCTRSWLVCQPLFGVFSSLLMSLELSNHVPCCSEALLSQLLLCLGHFCFLVVCHFVFLFVCVIVSFHDCIITSSCRFVNPYRGQFQNILESFFSYPIQR